MYLARALNCLARRPLQIPFRMVLRLSFVRTVLDAGMIYTVGPTSYINQLAIIGLRLASSTPVRHRTSRRPPARSLGT